MIVEEFLEQGSHPFAQCDLISFVFCSDLGVPGGFSQGFAATDKFLHSEWRYSRSFKVETLSKEDTTNIELQNS